MRHTPELGSVSVGRSWRYCNTKPTRDRTGASSRSRSLSKKMFDHWESHVDSLEAIKLRRTDTTLDLSSKSREAIVSWEEGADLWLSGKLKAPKIDCRGGKDRARAAAAAKRVISLPEC